MTYLVLVDDNGIIHIRAVSNQLEYNAALDFFIGHFGTTPYEIAA